MPKALGSQEFDRESVRTHIKQRSPGLTDIRLLRSAVNGSTYIFSGEQSLSP